ncbi:MAG: helix-turn-helix transcriptional regulator [Rhodobacterales bacterium]|nr:helix-turn-helix transcriptional regulator [Rhodobacterales bacterium]
MQSLPNLSETRLATAIARIGRDRFEPAMWEFFQGIVRPDNLIILAYRDAGPPLILYLRFNHPQVFAELDQTYVAGAFRLDPYHDLHRQRAPDGAYRLRDIAPDAFHRSRYFIEYYDQTTLLDEISFVVWPAPGVSLNLCLGRDATSGKAFSAAEMECCQRLAPVVTAMAREHWRGIVESNGPAEDVAARLASAARQSEGIALSPRQAEVALLILRGHSTVSIGLRLGLSPQTVKVFRKQLYARCGISSQAELFAMMLPLLKEDPQSPGASAFGRGSAGGVPVAR